MSGRPARGSGGVRVETLGALLPVLAVVGLGLGVLYWVARRQRLLREALQQLAARDGLHPTATPCGLDARQYASRIEATPRGDRRSGIRYGLEGPTTVALAGHDVTVQVGCFEWWYEVRVQNDKTVSYQRRTTTVAGVRLPVVVPGRVEVRPEGLLGRIGLRRADQQLESEEFNRRFHVQGSDPRLTVQFLDAAMQHRLLTSAIGRTVHLEGDLLVLGGSPSHRDGSLPGVIAELPAAIADVLGLLRAVPAQVWRTAAPVADGEGSP